MTLWDATVDPEKPHARCVQCGSTELVGVCHDCGAGLCQEHVMPQEPQPWYRYFPEFSGLNLERTEMGEVGIHCKSCFHYAYKLDFLIWAGFLVVFAGFFITLALSWRNLGGNLWGWGIVVLGLILMVAGLLFSIIHTERQTTKKAPALPVIGRFPTVEVREGITGKILLDAGGNYHAEVDQAGGRFDYTVRFIPLDQARRTQYQQKYRNRSPADNRFNSGFIVGKGAARLAFQGPAGELHRQANTLELSAPLQHQPFLNGSLSVTDHSPPPPRWTRRYPYVFELNEDLPVQIIPALIADGDQLGLELLVQIAPWPKLDLNNTGLRVERLKLCVPDELGEPLDWHPSAQHDPPGDPCDGPGVYSLVWSDIPMDSGLQAENAVARRDIAHAYARFYVRFANQSLLKQRTVRGQLQVRLENKLLSGLEEIALCFPLGQERQDATISSHTVVSVGFHLNLHSLLFRGMSVFERKLHFGVIPDYRLIIALVQRLEEAGVYVKRVADNSPQKDQAGAHLVGRAWQIDGRFYHQLYPLNFTLGVTGVEVYGDEPWPVRGRTTIDIRVEALVRTRQMYRQLQQLLASLITTLNQLLGSSQPAGGTRTGPGTGPAPGSTAGTKPPPHARRPWSKP